MNQEKSNSRNTYNIVPSIIQTTEKWEIFVSGKFVTKVFQPTKNSLNQTYLASVLTSVAFIKGVSYSKKS